MFTVTCPVTVENGDAGTEIQWALCLLPWHQDSQPFMFQQQKLLRVFTSQSVFSLLGTELFSLLGTEFFSLLGTELFSLIPRNTLIALR